MFYICTSIQYICNFVFIFVQSAQHIDANIIVQAMDHLKHSPVQISYYSAILVRIISFGTVINLNRLWKVSIIEIIAV